MDLFRSLTSKKDSKDYCSDSSDSDTESSSSPEKFEDFESKPSCDTEKFEDFESKPLCETESSSSAPEKLEDQKKFNPKSNIKMAGGDVQPSTSNNTNNYEVNVHKPLEDSKPPKFKGGRPSQFEINEYVTDARRFATSYKLDDKTAIEVLRKGLSDDALEWYNTNKIMKDPCMASLEEYFKSFREHFGKPPKATEALNEFRQLIQKTEEGGVTFLYRCIKTCIQYQRNDRELVRKLQIDSDGKTDEEKNELLDQFEIDQGKKRALEYFFAGLRVDISTLVKGASEDITYNDIKKLSGIISVCEERVREDEEKKRLATAFVASKEQEGQNVEAFRRPNPSWQNYGPRNGRNYGNSGINNGSNTGNYGTNNGKQRYLQTGQKSQPSQLQPAQSGGNRRPRRLGQKVVLSNGKIKEIGPDDCFRCGEAGHHASSCNPNTPPAIDFWRSKGKKMNAVEYDNTGSNQMQMDGKQGTPPQYGYQPSSSGTSQPQTAQPHYGPTEFNSSAVGTDFGGSTMDRHMAMMSQPSSHYQHF